MNKQLVILSILLSLTGCSTHYYRVTDARSGDVYYTKSHWLSSMTRSTGDDLTFTDLQSGDLVWLRATTISEITKQEVISELSPSPLVETAAVALQPKQ